MRHSITMESSLMHVSLVLTILDLKHQVLVSLSIIFHKNLKVQAMPFIIDIYIFFYRWWPIFCQFCSHW